MSEQLRDFLAVTTLAASLSSGATSLQVTSGANFPSDGTFDVRIDNEIIKVTGVSGTTWTIVRAQGTPATTAATHAAGAQIREVVTARQVLALLTTIAENHQTGTSYTLVLTDAGLFINCDNASDFALTIPANASVAFPVGTVIQVGQGGAGQVTVDIDTDTLQAPNGAKTAQQYSVLSLYKRGATEWWLSGDSAA